jgi:DNA-binding CsgD family transcriptional regulator
VFHATDAGRLAEIASEADSLFEYERAALETIGAAVGFDVAMFKRASGYGPYKPGLDARIERACRPHLVEFGREIQPVAQAALRQGRVAVDVDVFGTRRLERLSYYQLLMRPHGGKSTALVWFTRRGTITGSLALGRTRGGFHEAELEYLRGLAPILSVCEASALSPPSPPAQDLGFAATLTAREREVLGYLGLGYTNAEIAVALGSAGRTVRNQLSSIYAKLGVASRAEAVAVSAALGLAVKLAP